MNIKNAAVLRAALEGDLENFVVASTPGGIEAQEARGQQAFVAAETMPRKLQGSELGGDARAVLEYLGFKVLGEADDLFLNVELPAGWKKVSTSHSMWSKVTDAQGRERLTVFYKAAFYDERTHFFVKQRFTRGVEPVHGYGDDFRLGDDECGVVKDQGVIVWRTGRTAQQDNPQLYQELRDEALVWLTERYPDWENSFAYWDEEAAT